MADFPTEVDLFNIFAEDLLARAVLRPEGRRVSAEEIFTPGSDINLIGAAVSAMGGEIVRQLARSTQDLTLDGARGAALTRWVADRYSPEIAPKEASPALVTLSFSRPTAGAGATTYAAGSRVATVGGIEFELTTAAPFGASDLGPITASARAVNAGLSGNVVAGSITRFVTAPGDNTLAVTNPERASGGDDVESEASLRERTRRFFGAQRRGTGPAIEAAALAVAGVRQATAEEETVDGEITGRVQLYIADANGQANAELRSLVSAALLDARCFGIGVEVIGATLTFVPIVLALAFESNVDTVLAFDQVRQTTVGRVAQLGPRDTLHRALISDAARSVPGVIVTDGSIVAPVGDVVPVGGEILRTRADLITVAP